MEHLKIIAAQCARLCCYTKFPVESWLEKQGIKVCAVFPETDYSVVFGGVIEVKSVNGNVTVEMAKDYEKVFEDFIEKLPELRAEHVRKQQEKVIELQEELQQVAA